MSGNPRRSSARWRMLALVTGVLGCGLPIIGAQAAEQAEGVWSGEVLGLPLVLRLRQRDGRYEGTLESPRQARGVEFPIAEVEVSGERLVFTAPRINGRYEARWNAQRKVWDGTWRQGRDFPLTLRKMTDDEVAALTRRRPQVEAAEAALAQYHVEEVSFENRTAGVTLSGTWSAPRGPGPFPAAILLAGSGPFTRDGDLGGHKVLLVLADALNRAGIAVLRYDKRGTGRSTGAFASATMADFASDAAAALAYLRGRPDVASVGLIGHSEGGAVAPLVAAEHEGVRFLVLLAAPGLRGDRVLLTQSELILRAGGASEQAIADARRINALIYDTAMAQAGSAVEAMRAALAPEVAAGRLAAEKMEAVLREADNAWIRHFIAHDPAPVLARVKASVLAITGARDLQVEPKANLAAIRAASAGNPDVTVEEAAGLNHLLQNDAGLAPLDYGGSEETIAPAALTAITDWVRARTR